MGSQAVAYTTGVPAMIGTMMLMTGTWQDLAYLTLKSLIRIRLWMP